MQTQQNDSAKKAIVGLAVLTGNLAGGKDYIDLFVPLIAQCILSSKAEVISVTELQNQMRNTFGMTIPQNTLKIVLSRACKKGYVELKQNVYRPNNQILAGLNFAARYQDIIRRQNGAILKLIEFARVRFQAQLTEIEAENALLAYIEKHDTDILSCFLKAEPPVIFKPDSTKKFEYIVINFISECYKSDSEGFKNIEMIVKGNFLSHTLFFPDLGQINKRFNKTEIYFDTALILRTLGYEGVSRQTSCKELLDLLYREGATFRCFRQTRDEVYGVLHACMYAMNRGDTEYGSHTFNYFKSAGFQTSDIELELSILDKKIEGFGIKVVDNPDRMNRFQIDEAKLDKKLEDITVYWRDRARQRKHDVDCLSAIYRLRRGRESIFVEDSIAVFVTANSTLCKAGLQYFINEGYLERTSIPVVITDYALTSLLWLKTPMTAPRLPMKFIIAECYAAVEPSETLWQKYVETGERLKEEHKISANEYYLLRYSQFAHRELMNLTMGDEDVITEGTLHEILEAVKMEIRKGDLDLLREERHILEETKREGLAKLDQERRIREETEAKLKLEQVSHDAKVEGWQQNIKQKARQIAHVICIGIYVLFIIIITFGIVFSFIKWHGNVWNYVFLAAYIIFTLMTIAHVMVGVTIKNIVSRSEIKLASWIDGLLRGWFFKTHD